QKIAGFDQNAFDTAVKDGHVFGTNGPVIEAEMRWTGQTGKAQPYGVKPFKPGPDARVRVRVSGAPWVPVDEVRFIVNGKVVKTVKGAEITKPTEPFGLT